MCRLGTVPLLLAVVSIWVVGCAAPPEVELAPGEKLELEYRVVDGLKYKAKSFTATNYEGLAQDYMTENRYVTSLDSIYSDGTTVRHLQFTEYSQVTYQGGEAVFDPEAKMVEGEQLWVRLGPKGEILDWRGLEGVRSFTSEDRNLRQMIVHGAALSFLILPREPVGSGDEWTQTVEMPIHMRQGVLDFKVTNTYRLVGLREKNGHRCARINVTSVVVGTGEGHDEMRDYHFSIDIEGEGKGEIYFGHELGYLVFSHQEMNLETEHTSVRGREEPKTEYFSAKVESEVVLVE